MASFLRGVFDTNVLLAAKLTPSAASPAAEILDRWQRREFTFLYSLDILTEYADKLRQKGISAEVITTFLRRLLGIGEAVSIVAFHFRHYPVDPDDVRFLLCALNGRATHLVTYDPHLLSLRPFYTAELAICSPIEFLVDCRRSTSPK